jgi:predicted PurR-regulated permease PerM
MARLVSLILLTFLIVCLGMAFYQVIQPFLLPLFLAAVLAILFQPLFQRFLQRTGNRTSLAAALTTASILTLIMAPILIGTVIGAYQLNAWAVTTLGSRDWERKVEKIRHELDVDQIVSRLEPYVPERIDPQKLEQQARQSLRELSSTIGKRTLGIAASTFGIVGTIAFAFIGIGMLITALYYFLADGPALLAAAEELIPLHRDYQRQLLTRFVLVTRAVVFGTFAAAIAQGLATGAGLYLGGFHQFFLISILATLSALIPLAGTWFVWMPCVAWLALDQHWTAVVLLSLYHLLFVGTLDNVIRSYVLSSDVKLHPLLAFISVLGGLQWLGLWGVFIGPIVASCLHALVQIFNLELQALSREKRSRSEQDLHPVSEGAAATLNEQIQTQPPLVAATTPANRPTLVTAALQPVPPPPKPSVEHGGPAAKGMQKQRKRR